MAGVGISIMTRRYGICVNVSLRESLEVKYIQVLLVYMYMACLDSNYYL